MRKYNYPPIINLKNFDFRFVKYIHNNSFEDIQTELFWVVFFNY